MKELEDIQEQRRREKAEKSQLEKEIGRFHQTRGMLEGKMKDFQEQEAKILEKTGVSLLRNLLGELESEEVRAAQKQLREAREEAEKSCEAAKQERDALYRKEEEQSGQQMETARQLNALQYEMSEQERWMADFRKAEEECLTILKLYDLDDELLYDRETAQKKMEDKIREQRKRIAGEQAEERLIRDMLDGMEHNNVYLPNSILECLEEADVPYETGEDYLQNLEQQLQYLHLLAFVLQGIFLLFL